MTKARSIISSISSRTPQAELSEGLASVAASKLADLARGYVLKPHPLIVLHRSENNSTITFKLKRGLINHQLIQHEDGKGDKVLAKGPSAGVLVARALKEVHKLIAQGYLEI